MKRYCTEQSDQSPGYTHMPGGKDHRFASRAQDLGREPEQGGRRIGSIVLKRAQASRLLTTQVDFPRVDEPLEMGACQPTSANSFGQGLDNGMMPRRTVVDPGDTVPPPLQANPSQQAFADDFGGFRNLQIEGQQRMEMRPRVGGCEERAEVTVGVMAARLPAAITESTNLLFQPGTQRLRPSNGKCTCACPVWFPLASSARGHNFCRKASGSHDPSLASFIDRGADCLRNQSAKSRHQSLAEG